MEILIFNVNLVMLVVLPVLIKVALEINLSVAPVLLAIISTQTIFNVFMDVQLATILLVEDASPVPHNA
jgi:hypothetical protein